MDADEILKRDKELREDLAIQDRYHGDTFDGFDMDRANALAYLANITAAERALIEAARDWVAADASLDRSLLNEAEDRLALAYRALLAAMAEGQR